MSTRRDQTQSYQFMVQRVVSALVLRETDPAQSPLRRMSGAAFASVMVAALVVAVVGVIGLISPGGNERWRSGEAVIVERETGATFAWLPDADGESHLHPTANFTSAALLIGSTTSILVSRTSLADAPRGQRLGIIDAPDSLPDPADLLDGPWTLCSAPARTMSGEVIPSTSLKVGARLVTGVDIGSGTFLARDAETGSLHLIWHSHQYPIPAEAPVIEGLGLRLQPEVSVGTAWLEALPAGEPLAPIRPDGFGEVSAVVPGAAVGQISVVELPGGDQYYLVGRESLVAITAVQAQIQLADPDTASYAYGGAPPVALPIPPGLAAPREESVVTDPTDAPANVPDMVAGTSERSTVCASFTAVGVLPAVTVEAVVDGSTAATATPRRTEDGTVLADHVEVEPGHGAVVESLVSPTAPSGAVFLVTDEGRRYAIPSSEALDALGYGDAAPVRMPASLVTRIPSGPSLDEAAARTAR